MDEAGRKLRVFIICVVMSAVLIGAIYYFTDVYGTSDVSEGTLVKAHVYPKEQMIVSADEYFRK